MKDSEWYNDLQKNHLVLKSLLLLCEPMQKAHIIGFLLHYSCGKHKT